MKINHAGHRPMASSVAAMAGPEHCGAASGPVLIQPAQADHRRSLRALLDVLPAVAIHADEDIDFAATPVQVLATIAGHAEASAACLGLGLSAIGNLIPYAAPEMGDGTVSSDTIEALGWLMAELGDTAAACFVLAAQCRQQCAAAASKSGGPVHAMPDTRSQKAA